MDEINPYQTPHSEVADVVTEPEVPPAILKKIKGGWIVAIISGTLTLLLTLLAMFGRDVVGYFSAWMLLDVGLILVLAYGIYKRSRTAATIMFVYFVVSKIQGVVLTGQFSGGILAVIFIYFYFQAMIGTYQYHRFLRDWRSGQASAGAGPVPLP